METVIETSKAIDKEAMAQLERLLLAQEENAKKGLYDIYFLENAAFSLISHPNPALNGLKMRAWNLVVGALKNKREPEKNIVMELLEVLSRYSEKK